MRLLKKGTLYLWDDQAQRSFDTLKHALVSAHSLVPPTTHVNLSSTWQPHHPRLEWFWFKFTMTTVKV